MQVDVLHFGESEVSPSDISAWTDGAPSVIVVINTIYDTLDYSAPEVCACWCEVSDSVNQDPRQLLRGDRPVHKKSCRA